MKKTTIGIVVTAFVGLAGCGDTAGDVSTDVVGDTRAALEAEQFGVFEAFWPKSASDDVGRRAHGVAEVMLGTSLPEEPFLASASRALVNGDTWIAAVTDEVTVTYHGSFNDLRVSLPSQRLDSEEDLVRPALPDDVARRRFEQTFAALQERGLIEGRQFDLNVVRAANTRLTVGDAEGNRSSAVVEHNFTAMRQINGVEFANAGVKVAVRRTDQVVEVRLGGAAIRSEVQDEAAGPVERPVDGGSVFAATVDQDLYRARFKDEFPSGRAEWERVEYMLPLGTMENGGVVEPLYVISYAEVHGESVSRRKYAGYSLRDPKAAPVDLSEVADPTATGDERR